ncbi:hypothetical protein A225_0837 [Klebsiella michiganensis E718]|nr:hypothetical protein A225_0837 [Klebsiella michiganensis E718]
MQGAMSYCPFLFLAFNRFFIARPEKYYLIRLIFVVLL